MWNSGTIFIRQHVTSEEFNFFCQSIGGVEWSKNLDPPHSDQIQFVFSGEADNAITIVRVRDCDRYFYEENLDVYQNELILFKEKPKTFLEIAITDKQPTKADYLNYYELCSQVMKKWEGVLADLDEESLTYEEVANKLVVLNNS